MTTPTPGKPGHHVAATPPVSTPFSHLAAFSPHGNQGSKSVVPSPQHVKKSPANSQTLYGHPTSSSFGAINFDSPTAAALGTLPPLGDIALDANGGLILGGAGRTDEDEKKRKLQQVIDILKVNKGRVSEEGIERLARRIGLECLWEDQIGSSGSSRTLIIAGTGLSVDIDFTNNTVDKVSLSFPDSPDAVTKYANEAGRILLADLQLKSDENPITKMLDRFSVNLERLANLDKLSIMPTLNCHEAIGGIYESLNKLYEWEVTKIREEGTVVDNAVRTVMCLRSGRPIMNARDQVGLSIDYWQDNKVKSKNNKSKAGEEAKTWSIIVECAPSSALVYPSIRVSDKWISDSIEKPNPTADEILMSANGVVLDWQEPDNILLPSSDLEKSEGEMEGIEHEANGLATKLPDVSFVARFNPPLAVPYGIAVQIYNSTGAAMDTFHLSTFDGLIIPNGPDDKPEADGSHRRLERERIIPAYNQHGHHHQKVIKSHKNTLSIPKLDYGQSTTEVSFSHPRQLIEMLPTLRQYAFLSMLLERSFGPETRDTAPDDEKPDTSKTLKDEFKAFMAEAKSSEKVAHDQSYLPLEVSLYTHPALSIRVTFPLKKRVADIWFEIGLNGVLTVKSQNILAEDGSDETRPNPGKTLKPADLGNILEMTKDLDVFAEYIKARLE